MFRELLEKLVPIDDIFDEEESLLFRGLIDVYLRDFDESKLSANDMSDIIDIATNKVLEIRLLRDSKSSVGKQLDISQAVDRLRKQSDKLKENLATRRKDRIDPKKYGGFSIVDLAVGWDKRKKELGNKSKNFLSEEKKLRKSKMLDGNKNDIDANIVGAD